MSPRRCASREPGRSSALLGLTLPLRLTLLREEPVEIDRPVGGRRWARRGAPASQQLVDRWSGRDATRPPPRPIPEPDARDEVIDGHRPVPPRVDRAPIARGFGGFVGGIAEQPRLVVLQ